MFLPSSVLQSHHYHELVSNNEDEEKEVIAENETVNSGDNNNEEKGETQQEEALFDPPLYRQRYTAVVDIINEHGSKFVIDMGCSEGQFISKVKDMCPSVEKIIGVDVDVNTLRTNSNRLKPLTIEYLLKREVPLTLSLYNGSICEPDIRFRGADLIACIEVIEHLYRDTLDKVPHSLFGILEPKVVVITTPNCEYNVLFKNFSGMRHYDHKFEWTRKEFESWCSDIVKRYPYDLEISGVGNSPVEFDVGYCSQMAVFIRQTSGTKCPSSHTDTDQHTVSSTEELTRMYSNLSCHVDNASGDKPRTCFDNTDVRHTEYELVSEVIYPYEDLCTNVTQRIVNETDYIINHFFSDISDETEETFTREIPVEELLLYPGLKKFDISKENFLEQIRNKYKLSTDQKNLLVTFQLSDFMRDSWYSDESDDFDLDGDLSTEVIQDETLYDQIEESWD